VVGAGILGLAHALAAARRGKRVMVLDGDAQANGASIRNFGFVTVTGQQAGECWSRARRSRDVWAEVAPRRGSTWSIAASRYWPSGRRRRPSSTPFSRRTWARTAVCLSRAEAPDAMPVSNSGARALQSPHELRVESRDGDPARWRAGSRAHGVTFRWSTRVTGIDLPRMETSAGPVEADAAVICPGDDFTGPARRPDREDGVHALQAAHAARARPRCR
jgi:glycine/D-amino acid oxidase-like deaminating enzyme